MGLLVDGVWRDQWYDTAQSGCALVRSAARHRNWIPADGSAAPPGEGRLKGNTLYEVVQDQGPAGWAGMYVRVVLSKDAGDDDIRAAFDQMAGVAEALGG